MAVAVTATSTAENVDDRQAALPLGCANLSVSSRC